MNKKDLAVIKKIVGNMEESCITRMVSCYIDVNSGEINIMEPAAFLSIPEEELLQYCGLFRKAVTGKVNSTAMEVKYNTNELELLRQDKLRNEETIFNVCEKIRDNYKSEDNYCILFASGAWDVPPDRNKTDEYEEVYDFVLVTLIPCSLSQSGIVYDKPNNLLMSRNKDRALGVPQVSIIHPSFSEAHTNIDHSIVFMKSVKHFSAADSISVSLFDSKLPLSPENQKEGFHDIIKSGFEGMNIPYKAIQGVYDHISDLQIDADISGEEVKLSTKELEDVVITYGGLDDLSAEKVRKAARAYENCQFSVTNIAPAKLDIETDVATIKLNIRDVGAIQKTVIDGFEYYLIPARHIIIDDMSVE